LRAVILITTPSFSSSAKRARPSDHLNMGCMYATTPPHRHIFVAEFRLITTCRLFN
jgi:hypothetical protein